MEAARPTRAPTDRQRLGAMAARGSLWAASNSGCRARRAGKGRGGAGPPAARRPRTLRLRCMLLPETLVSRRRSVAKMSLSNKLTLDKLDVRGKRVVMR